MNTALQLPPTTVLHKSDVSLKLQLEIDPGNVYFRGHFDNFSVLPGVVQTGWAIQLAHTYLNTSTTMVSMANIKFHAPITADTTVLIDIEYNQDKNQLTFTYFNINDTDIKYSSGRINISPWAAP